MSDEQKIEVGNREGNDAVCKQNEQRRLAKVRRKEQKRKAREDRKAYRQQRKNAPKLTKEQRREKYTQKARDKRDARVSSMREKNVICFKCRRKGHSVANCTEQTQDDGRGGKICYRCGNTEHHLHDCPQIKPEHRVDPRNSKSKLDYNKLDLPFATCYVCNGRGHLASQCDQNTKGVYPGGGGCRECGSKEHVVANCPESEKNRKKREKSEAQFEVDVEELLEDEQGMSREKTKKGKKKKKVVTF